MFLPNFLGVPSTSGFRRCWDWIILALQQISHHLFFGRWVSICFAVFASAFKSRAVLGVSGPSSFSSSTASSGTSAGSALPQLLRRGDFFDDSYGAGGGGHSSGITLTGTANGKKEDGAAAAALDFSGEMYSRR